MFRRFALLLVVSFGAFGEIPTPRAHLGWEPGADHKLADYTQLRTYFEKLHEASGRLRLEIFGQTSLGKPMLVAFISSEENIRQLDRYKQINRRLALGEASTEEARELAREGKAIVWIDSGLHATEVAPSQHAFDLAYRMVTAEDDETRRIRDKVILLQVPCINPDGLDWVAQWYMSNAGTPYELAPLPHLYHKYAGHDNNRDWFMMNLAETRHVSRMFYHEWFPHIVYNQHQSPEFPARIFVPPYAEPKNPNIPAAVMEGVNIIGAAMRERFARENKPGALSYHGFDGWWNGGLRTAAKFHNMHGILTETAAATLATPKTWQESDLPARFGNGIPTKEPTIFYPLPWLGGMWNVRSAIDYMLTADYAILDLAAVRSEDFLYKAWALARESIRLGSEAPYAYVVPAAQWDFSAAQDMLRRLQLGGIRVHIALDEFTASGRGFPKGSYVLLAAQPFRPYLIDLMEPQRYPEIRTGESGPTKKPYDVAGWTLPMNMGVEVVRVDAPFEAPLDIAGRIPAPAASRNSRENVAYLTLANLLKQDKRVRWGPMGEVLVDGETAAEEYGRGVYELKQPRTGLYESFTANMDTGWTQYVLEQYQIPHALIHNEEMRTADLRSRYDVILIASQAPDSILFGHREGERASRSTRYDSTPQRPEYTGGIELEGLARLRQFVREGGTLIAFDRATELPVKHFPLPLRPLLRVSDDPPATGYWCPGSLLRIEPDSTHPIAFGMPRDAFAYSTGGQAWDIALLPEYNQGERQVGLVARYASKNVLASGWLSGEQAVAGKNVLLDVRHGKGRVILFGFRPQFRAQSAGTFKLILNAIYLSAANPIRP